jgi:general secretion pathway protein E
MTPSIQDPAHARQAVADARARARANGSTVLDELRTAGEDDPSGLAEVAGVSAITQVQDVARVLCRVDSRQRSQPSLQHVAATDGREWLLMADPWDEAELAQASAKLGRYVEPAAATGALLRALGLTELASDAKPSVGREAAGLSRSGLAAPPATAGSGGAVGFVDRAVQAAFRDGASDVHFECDRSGVTVKLRLDGVMAPFARMDGQREAEEAISRIKVLAQLDITERRLPQDGRFRFEAGGVELDLRVSIMPSVFGEDAVLRLLDKSHLRAQDQQVTLDALGFEADGAKRIRSLSNLPNGMLLVTGPTGSGKTTTVYAALSEINTGLEKIITIEDPVEYELPGVLQIPVNERKGLTFAKGLRSILRHDPDRILVGEIRDAETAEIAVQSALTGHLVFTTVHANSLFDVIGRFRHFGIDMFGFVSSLNGVVVQRLMRRLCSACCAEREPSADEQVWLAKHGREHMKALPAPKGCGQCHQTGYRGRFVIAEVHWLDDSFRDLIMRQAEVTELKRAAFGETLRPLVQQALDRVQQSKTSLEELFRVVGQV